MNKFKDYIRKLKGTRSLYDVLIAMPINHDQFMKQLELDLKDKKQQELEFPKDTK